MAKQFLVWKDRNCNGVNPEWLSLTGEEFYEFIQREENKDRRFIKMPALTPDDDDIIIEANEAEYRKYREEKRHFEYIREYESQHETVSVYSYEDEDNANLYDKIASDDISVEEAVEKTLIKGKLHDALKRLTPEEAEIINLYYFTDGATENSCAEKLGIPRMTYRNRKSKVLEVLKKYLVNF